MFLLSPRYISEDIYIKMLLSFVAQVTLGNRKVRLKSSWKIIFFCLAAFSSLRVWIIIFVEQQFMFPNLGG